MIVTEDTKRIAMNTLKFLITNPEKHNQENWVLVNERYPFEQEIPVNLCNTTLCAAGATIFLEDGPEALCDTVEGRRYGGKFSARAGHHLGLNEHEKDMLFYEMNEEIVLKRLLAISLGDQYLFHKITS